MLVSTWCQQYCKYNSEDLDLIDEPDCTGNSETNHSEEILIELIPLQSCFHLIHFLQFQDCYILCTQLIKG